MKYKTLLLSLLFSLLSFQLKADEGDTLIVQTIDWETPVLPGWNSPRSGIYPFPGDTIDFTKILMYYTLKCDPDQNPSCGEWDYTTHTRIHEHTGIYDSNLYFHPNYMVNNASPDSFMYMNDVSYRYEAALEYMNETMPTNEATIGAGGEFIQFQSGTSPLDGKIQFIYKFEELSLGGLMKGDVTGLKMPATVIDLSFDHFEIRMQNTDIEALPFDSIITHGFTSVYNRNVIISDEMQDFGFSRPFEWDSVSNILLELNWADNNGIGKFHAGDAVNNTAKSSVNADYFLDFEGWDYINVPAEVFETIDSAITISFWQYGNPDIQPINSSILEGVDSAGHRVLNIHLPWSNGGVYWDAGWDGGYDRINRTADEGNYKGQWNFWTFTKDLRTGGVMRIFLNGEFWFQGSGKYKPMAGIAKFRIGAGITYNGFYAGMVDDVRIWDTIFDWDLIKDWMYKDVSASHPHYDHLRANYKFNDGEGFIVDDSSPNDYDGSQFGYPEWKNYRGVGRFRNASSMDLKPMIILENGNYNPATLDSTVVVDTLEKGAVNIVLFDPDDPPVPTDTLTKWPSYYDNYIYNDKANATDSTLVAPDGIFYHEDLPYYGTPYEIVNPWEIARYITPYGNGLSLGEGWTWVFDVTDYAPMLRDSVHITAGNFQELLDLKFYMIEGTPPRDVKKIEKVYSGYFSLANMPTTVAPDTIELMEDATTFSVKTRTSGHEFSNATNCAEFCYKVHHLQVNEENIYQWQIIQECSDNPLFPQGGTWIYDRAGWCPGAKVAEHDIEITPYITGDEVILDYNSQADPYGGYSLEVQLFSYGDPNFSLDAAVDEIIAPNNDKVYDRFNPTASSPIIIIQNRGGETLNKVKIEYGPAGSIKTHSWTGSLNFMEKERVVLEELDWEEWVNGDGVFTVSLSEPNDAGDENTINDVYQTSYDLPSIFPTTFVIHFKTNTTAYQNTYEILTNTGIQIYEKTNFEPNTLYVDTVTLFSGCYDFYLYDSGDNGISFWANNEGSGYLRFYDLNEERIQNFNGDFGDQIYHSFYTDLYLGTNDPAAGRLAFDILPNPSDGNFTISYALKDRGPIKLSIYTTSGQRVWFTEQPGSHHGKVRINLSDAQAGMYTCILESNGVSLKKKFVVVR